MDPPDIQIGQELAEGKFLFLKMHTQHLTGANTSKLALFPANSALTMLVRDGFDGRLVLCVEVWWWCVVANPLQLAVAALLGCHAPSLHPPLHPSLPPRILLPLTSLSYQGSQLISVSQDYIDGCPYPDTL